MHDPLQQGQPQGGQGPGLIPENNFGTHQAAAQHFGVAQLEPEDDGWGKIGVIMVVLALAFAGGVAYFIATSGSSEPSETQAAASAPSIDAGGAATEAPPAAAAEPAEPTEADAPPEADTPTTDPAAFAAEPTAAKPAPDGGAAVADPSEVSGTIGLLRENGEIDRPAGLISLAIESEPEGATVIRKRDGVRLGMTPYRYETEAARGEVAFLLKLEGYRTTSVSMPGDKDSVRQVMLLPGSGGAVVPAAPTASPEPVATAPKPRKPKAAAAPKKPRKPKSASRPKAPSPPKKPSSPKSKPKPKGGKVDYKADPIPL